MSSVNTHTHTQADGNASCTQRRVWTPDHTHLTDRFKFGGGKKSCRFVYIWKKTSSNLGTLRNLYDNTLSNLHLKAAQIFTSDTNNLNDHQMRRACECDGPPKVKARVDEVSQGGISDHCSPASSLSSFPTHMWSHVDGLHSPAPSEISHLPGCMEERP